MKRITKDATRRKLLPELQKFVDALNPDDLSAILTEAYFMAMADPQPTTIPAIAALRQATRIQAEIRSTFGFEASLQYCAAMVAFVDAQAAHMDELERRLAALEPGPEGSPEDVEAMLHVSA